jgi:phenylpropionate dioxygenase-like ring-hydroxylating dioxygenase large terminal subunit
MLLDPVLTHDWHPVATVAQLAANPIASFRLLGEDLVIWQSTAGPRIWQDLCVHRGTRLSLGRIAQAGERLTCPYHGWEYDHSGRCAHIPAHPDQTPPAKAVVKHYAVQERYGVIWACLGEPANDIPRFEEWEKPGFRSVVCGPYPVNASAPRVVENFLDVAHFPFVHAGYLGVADRPEISDYEARITPDGVISEGVRVFQPNGYGDGKEAEVEYTYKALRPLTAYLRKETPTQTLSIMLNVAPHEAVGCTAWMVMAMNYMHDAPEAELIKFQDTIFLQDAPILTSQRPELLPVDLQAELHLKSDRTAIAYRQWLRQLGVQIGVA